MFGVADGEKIDNFDNGLTAFWAVVEIGATGIESGGDFGLLGDWSGVLDVVGRVIVRYVMPNGHWESEELLLL